MVLVYHCPPHNETYILFINLYFFIQVEFLGEEGTGLGPTLEFYALIAAELQQKSLGMWLTDDEIADDLSRKVGI